MSKNDSCQFIEVSWQNQGVFKCPIYSSGGVADFAILACGYDG